MEMFPEKAEPVEVHTLLSGLSGNVLLDTRTIYMYTGDVASRLWLEVGAADRREDRALDVEGAEGGGQRCAARQQLPGKGGHEASFKSIRFFELPT